MRGLVTAALSLVGPLAARAQARPWAQVGGQAILALEQVDPVPGGESLTELRMVQPALHVHAGAFGRLRLTGMVNLEGLTMGQGELAPGMWGEGFIDRRHPHTYLHELVVTGEDLLGSADGAARLSLSAGKGFAPFGTDDPMVRPFLRYPVNHHLAQILERAVAIAAFHAGAVTLEAGVFNGDEPERPGQFPRLSRVGDSWSARLTGEVLSGVALEGSYAHVHSPEHRPGAGTDQAKYSLAARWERRVGGHPTYGLVEWARTAEADGFFVFHSVLAEGAWSAGPHRLQYRFERTERPEEERASRFRTVVPHLENSITGITRWTTHTLGYELDAVHHGTLGIRPLVELAHASMTRVGGGLFDIQDLYGRDHIWSLSLGLRLEAGMPMRRMGRYGAAEETMPMMRPRVEMVQ